LTILALRRVENKIGPLIVHHSGLQCCVYGSIAALGKKNPIVNAITGLGYIFTSVNWRTRLLKRGLAMLLPRLLNIRQSLVLVQNPDDQADLEKLGIDRGRIVSDSWIGRRHRRIPALPEPKGPIHYRFRGRLLTDKGIRAVVAAHGLLRNQGHDVNLIIAGNPDPANPASVLPEEARGMGVVSRELRGSAYRRNRLAVGTQPRGGVAIATVKVAHESAGGSRVRKTADRGRCTRLPRDCHRRPNRAFGYDRESTGVGGSHSAASEFGRVARRYGKAARQLVVDRLSAENYRRGDCSALRSIAV